MNNQKIDLHILVGEYENFITSRSEDLFDKTIRFLNALTNALGKGGLVERKLPEHVITFWYTRIASALTQYFTIQSENLDIQKIKILSRYKRIIVSIFAASGYRGSEHLKWHITRGGNKKPHAYEIFLLLNIISIDEMDDDLLDFALSQNDDYYFQFMLSALNEKFIIMPQGDKNRNKILQSMEGRKNINIKDSDWMQIFAVWMFCSYVSGTTGALFKKSLNDNIRNKLISQGLHDIEFKKNLSCNTKPRLLILIEHFQKYHAMYRSYATQLRSLKRDFEVVAISSKGEIDDASNDIFDKIITFDQASTNFKSTIEIIKSVEADIIYYPSIGMKGWAILASNLRLAPLQIATQGHPDTPATNCIDYVIIHDMIKDFSDRYFERLVILNQKITFVPHNDLSKIAFSSKKIKETDVIKIAVNSKCMKINNEFMAMCEKILKIASRKVQFHFFPGETGITLDGIAMQIKKRIPDAQIYGYMSYQELMKNLRDCDISLVPFPFGNTNSTVDACLMGVPVVAYLGETLASQTDYAVIKASGLPLEQICSTKEEYLEMAMKLIHNDEYRSTINSKTFEEIKRNLFGSEVNYKDELFVNAVTHLWQNHKGISDKKYKIINFRDAS